MEAVRGKVEHGGLFVAALRFPAFSLFLHVVKILQGRVMDEWVLHNSKRANLAP